MNGEGRKEGEKGWYQGKKREKGKGEKGVAILLMHLLFLGLGGRRGGCEISSSGRQTHHSLCTGSLHPTQTQPNVLYIAEEEEEGLELGVNQVQKCIVSLHPNTSTWPNVRNYGSPLTSEDT